VNEIFFYSSIIYPIWFFCMLPSFAQHSDPRWERWDAEMVSDKTYVEGFGVLEYDLYRVDASAGETNIMKESSFHSAFIIYLEELDFIVDYGSIIGTDNPNLSENVKHLMARHGANVSVTMSPNSNGSKRVIINIDTSYLREEPSVLANYDIIIFNIYYK
jgi:hypothetical protein